MEEDVELQRLEQKLAELKARMPAHTVRPAMLMELEDLEDEVARLRAKRQRESTGNA